MGLPFPFWGSSVDSQGERKRRWYEKQFLLTNLSVILNHFSFPGKDDGVERSQECYANWVPFTRKQTARVTCDLVRSIDSALFLNQNMLLLFFKEYNLFAV